MKTDRRARICVRLRRTWHDIHSALTTLGAGLRCRMWGIQLGTGVVFEGKPVLFRAPEAFITVGDQVRFLSSPSSNLAGINRPCYLSVLRPGARVTLGRRCGLSGTVISAAVSVTLGDDVLCGANTTIIDNDFHHVDPTKRLSHEEVPAAPVVIEDNVWLGMGSTVLKGVRIGRNSVVAAGSVVVRDIPPNVIAGGVPARVLKAITTTPERDTLEVEGVR